MVYSNETFHLLGVYYNKSKTELTVIAFLSGWKLNWFTFEIGTSLSRWRTGFSGSSCSGNSSGKLPSIWGWSHHTRKLITWCPFRKLPYFANCLFWDAFLRVVFMPLCVLPFCVMPFGVLPLCVMPFACCLFALCLSACCLSACCLSAWCLLSWCLFLRDMMVAFLVFLPFTVVFFFLPTLTWYISYLTCPFSLLGYRILS